MPVTIKTNELNARSGETGEFVGIDAVTDKTTEQRVAEITAASNVEQTKIQQKGTEVLDSLPDEYTDLINEVDEIKSALGIPAEETLTLTEIRGKFIHKDRSIRDTSGTFCYTTPVEINDGDSVSITGMGSVNISAITETDASGNIINIIDVYSADSVMETLKYTATKHEYISFSYNYSALTTIKLQRAGTLFDSVLTLEKAGNNYVEKFVNDIYKFSDGYYQYNTGNFITNTTLFRYKVIPVDPSKDKFLKYSYTIESSSSPIYIACFLTGVGSGSLTGARLTYTTAGTFSGEIPVPENAASLVLSLRSTNYSWKFYLREAHEGKTFDTLMDMASSGATGETRVGGYIFQNKAENPEILYQNQHGYNQSYYSANETVGQFKCISDQKPPILDGVFNQLESEEIDFTPTDSRYTRIVCGKDWDDNFFVSYESSNQNGTPGAEVNCKLEMTRDFVTFTPVMRGADNTSLPDVPYVAGAQHLKFLSVKQFSNGDYLIVANGQTANDTFATVYFRMSADRSSVAECEYTAFDGTVKPMEDEFAGGAYDWHVDVKGNRAIATTYGTRQPDTDYGRVWYTEDCGKTWKQVFQTNTHYQDGVDSDDSAVTQTHTHGVMLDPYANRMFVICGEDNRNIFWNDHGLDANNDNWNVIPIRNAMKGVSQIASFTQVVNGFAFDKSLIFGSDNPNFGCLYRINKLDGNVYSEIEIAHEILPNYFTGNTYYCGGEIFRRDLRTPMFFCMTRENNMPTEAQNELLNEMHKGRVIASYDGINFAEVWLDNTYGAHSVYFGGAVTTKNFSYCTRGMNCYLLKNGDAVIKYSGRENYFFGGDNYPTGYSNGCCKVLWLKNAEQFV